MESETRNRSARAHDLWLEVFLIFNFASLTGDILLAHSENSFRNRAEYIPLWFSGAAAAMLIIGMAARLRSQSLILWKWIGYGVGWLSICVGVAGVGYHLESGFFYEHTLKSLTYAAPFAAPLAYVGLGSLLLMNRMVPFPTREWAKWVVFFAVGGFAGNFGLSLSDHAVNGFFRWTEWIPVSSCALAVGFLLMLFAGEEKRKIFQNLRADSGVADLRGDSWLRFARLSGSARAEQRFRSERHPWRSAVCAAAAAEFGPAGITGLAGGGSSGQAGAC